MQEIIKIEDRLVEGEKIQMVNARDLWEKLEVKSKFADWAKNKVYQAQLIEGQDYITVSKNLETGGHIKEYYIPDPRFGEVHTYHIDILKSVFGDN